jgi:membrane protein DedA with SNARE-associated domain
MKEMMLSMIQHYGYAAVFVSMMLGVIGLPLPVEFLLLFAGSIVAAAHLQLHWLIAFAWFGAVTGMTVSYGLGKWIGIERISKVTRYVHLTEARLNLWAERFQRRGPILIVIGYFIAGLRHASPLLAGASGMAYPRFISYALIGGLTWIVSFSVLGQRFGHHWHSIVRLLHHPLMLIAGALIVVLVIALKRGMPMPWVKFRRRT